MKTHEPDHDDLVKHIEEQLFSSFKEMANSYTHHHRIDVDAELDSVVIIDLQRRLEKYGINTSCPECGDKHVVKNGKRKSIQRYKCKNCATQFTVSTNTITEKTKWPGIFGLGHEDTLCTLKIGVDNDHYPRSRKDAEAILIDFLSTRALTLKQT